MLGGTRNATGGVPYNFCFVILKEERLKDLGFGLWSRSFADAQDDDGVCSPERCKGCSQQWLCGMPSITEMFHVKQFMGAGLVPPVFPSPARGGFMNAGGQGRPPLRDNTRCKGFAIRSFEERHRGVPYNFCFVILKKERLKDLGAGLWSGSFADAQDDNGGHVRRNATGGVPYNGYMMCLA